MSPVPSTLTGKSGRTAPRRAKSSGPTSPPCGNSSPSRPVLTTWNSVRNGFLKPFNFGKRMWIGIWPPSKRAGTVPRARVPLVPRPEVLPFEPWPRPTRVFARFAPGAGRRWCTFRGAMSVTSVHFLDRHQMVDGPDHAADLRRVLFYDSAAASPQAERPQRCALLGQPADLRTNLRDLEPSHHAPGPVVGAAAAGSRAAARARSIAAGATSSSGRAPRGGNSSRRVSGRSAGTLGWPVVVGVEEARDLDPTAWVPPP